MAGKDTEDGEGAAELVCRAAAGDQRAWREIVRRYAPLVWRVARMHRLGDADAADVSQGTWVALAEHLDGLRRPERLAAWLGTTARRESLRVLAGAGRERPVPWPEPPGEADAWPERVVLREARDAALWQAFGTLPERCRRLLGLLAHAPELTYAQLGRALGMGTGSVGPTRGRCLRTLRVRLSAADEHGEVVR